MKTTTIKIVAVCLLGALVSCAPMRPAVITTLDVRQELEERPERAGELERLIRLRREKLRGVCFISPVWWVLAPITTTIVYVSTINARRVCRDELRDLEGKAQIVRSVLDEV